MKKFIFTIFKPENQDVIFVFILIFNKQKEHVVDG